MLFGHGLHWCLGAFIAEAHITQTLKQLLLRKNNLRRAERSRRKAAASRIIPAASHGGVRSAEADTASFDMKHRGGPQCPMPSSPSRYRSRPTAPTPSRRYLDRLGNPPAAAIRQKLDDTAFVHFMSMWVVRDDGSRTRHHHHRGQRRRNRRRGRQRSWPRRLNRKFQDSSPRPVSNAGRKASATSWKVTITGSDRDGSPRRESILTERRS